MKRLMFVQVRGDPVLRITELMYKEWLVEFEPSPGTGNVIPAEELVVLLKELKSQYGTIRLERLGS
jgi:hypothetical protein